MSTDNRYPFGSPSAEYCQQEGLNKLKDMKGDIRNRDMLMAFLNTADALFHELLTIRKLLEERRESVPKT